MLKMYHKRILWISSVVLFLIALPILMSYALGYKYNFAKHTFEATGIVYVKTYPRQSNVYLDGQLLGTRTPLQQSRLLPGHYNISIQKQDFMPWNKTVTVNQHMTTFVEDVVLFQNQAPQVLYDMQIKQILPTTDDTKYILLTNQDELQSIYLFDTDFEVLTLLNQFESSQDVELLSVSPNVKRLIYRQDGNAWLINLEIPKQTAQITGVNNSLWYDFKWHRMSDNIIYSQVADKLYRLQLNNNQVRIDSQLANVIYYFPYKDKVYYAQPENMSNKIVLYEADRDLQNSQQIVLLPQSDDLNLVPDEDTLTLLDKSNQFLYLIQPQAQELIASIYPNVTHASWYPRNKDKILMWNQNEIKVYFKDRDEEMLITRVTDPIQHAWWHPNGTYIFYAQSGQLKLVELDERDKRNKYHLTSIDSTYSLMMNRKGDIIYYYSPDDEKLYKQQIQ